MILNQKLHILVPIQKFAFKIVQDFYVFPIHVVLTKVSYPIIFFEGTSNEKIVPLKNYDIKHQL